MSAYAQAGLGRRGARAARRATAPPSSPAAPTSRGRSIAASALRRSSSTSRTRASAASRPTATAFGSARPTTLAELARAELVAPYAAVATAAGLAASPLLRNQGTVGGNLCQHTRCWYYRGEEWHCWLGGGDTCYAQIGDHRKHNLEPGDCISAHPSDLAPALAACGATVVLRSRDGERELPLLELYRRPTDENRSLVTLEPGEIVVAVQLPAPPDASTYLRTGERQAFSFPLVSVAAARRGDDAHPRRSRRRQHPARARPGRPARRAAGSSPERLEANGARDARRAGARR